MIEHLALNISRTDVRRRTNDITKSRGTDALHFLGSENPAQSEQN
jgi:hypothetical protein